MGLLLTPLFIWLFAAVRGKAAAADGKAFAAVCGCDRAAVCRRRCGGRSRAALCKVCAARGATVALVARPVVNAATVIGVDRARAVGAARGACAARGAIIARVARDAAARALVAGPILE